MEEAKHIEAAEAQRIEAGEAKHIEAGETSRSSRKVITFEPKIVINKGISVLGFVLRLFAVFGTTGSALSMGTTHESVVSLSQLILLKVKYSDLPTLMFFVVANAIAGGYLVLSLPVSIFHIFSTKAKTSRIILLVIDTVMLALVSSGASAATATVYLAHEGNTTANWPPICQQFDGFCERISGSLIGSFCAVILLMLIVINSAISLSRY
ncbi:Casparian strip membrane protein [Arabidopsis thaliana x Arabidopsis arenosa]|uniref:CASP-like protein n=1 Tax=Arabidopsis thaliana x Arabidopsis arenosa TaxID=1240361 RepID=A0A8T2C3A8_9BRAS|nr:Casparian strip membrane protein [Arabidopsis thaliana x Arabidopsis arenosa]